MRHGLRRGCHLSACLLVAVVPDAGSSSLNASSVSSKFSLSSKFSSSAG
jgi:hypothetical protein